MTRGIHFAECIDRLRDGVPASEVRGQVAITELWTPDNAVFNRLTLPLEQCVDPLALRPTHFRGTRLGRPVQYRVVGDYPAYLSNNQEYIGALEAQRRDSRGSEWWLPQHNVGDIAGSLLSLSLFDGISRPDFGDADLPDFHKEIATSAALQATFDAITALCAERTFISTECAARSGQVGSRTKSRPDPRRLGKNADRAFMHFLAASHSRDKSSQRLEQLASDWGFIV